MARLRGGKELLALSAIVVLLAGACGTSSGGGGDSIVVGGYNYKTLYPGDAGYISRTLPFSLEVFGSLFDPPKREGGDFQPDLALSYSYSDDFRKLRIDLRKGVTFSDGTPFDAEAVAYNFTRYRKPESYNSQYFDDVTAVTAVGKHRVELTFREPNATMISFLTYTPATLIGSPTAIKKAGSSFGLEPIGAGPFTVASNKPSEELLLRPFDGYYNAKNVHLEEIRFINTSPEAQVAYQHVASGSIDSTYVSAVSTPPNVLDDASKNPNITVDKDEDTLYAFLPVNTFRPPFDKLAARKAIDYCTDRESIAKNVQRGWVNPAYVPAGTDSLYYPEGGVAAARAQFPYKFEPAKGKDLVDQLGGLTFTLYNIGGHSQVIANALAQQWQKCGIEAKVESIPGPQLSQAYTDGSYQMAFIFTGGTNDPQLYTGFLDPTTAQGKHGFAAEHPEIVNLIRSGTTTDDTAKLTRIWREVWAKLNELAVVIPIMSGPNYMFQSKCLSGVDFTSIGPEYKNARLTC